MTELTITRPDDWHAHLRDAAALEHTCTDLARYFGRVIVMPNLSPPATTVAEAALGAPMEAGALEGLDEPIAGKPIIVFLRGGRVEYGLTLGGASAEGGGVTMGGGASDTPGGGMKP